MANIVTQLQNKNGDNLYPLAGGMAADSITTAMVQDDAVTSAKIDFSTFNGDISTGAIANGAVTSAKIADGAIATVDIANSAVTSGKIDWTTIGKKESRTTSAVVASGTNWTNCGPSITVATAGTYFFIGRAALEAKNDAFKHGLLRIYNSTTSAQIGEIADFYGMKIGDTSGVVSLVVFGIATVAANNVVNLQFRSPNSSNGISCSIENNSYPSLVCFRIGSAAA